jgi:hypothetical protein
VCLKPLSHLSTKAANVADRAALFNSKLHGLPTVHFDGNLSRK